MNSARHTFFFDDEKMGRWDDGTTRPTKENPIVPKSHSLIVQKKEAENAPYRVNPISCQKGSDLAST